LTFVALARSQEGYHDGAEPPSIIAQWLVIEDSTNAAPALLFTAVLAMVASGVLLIWLQFGAKRGLSTVIGSMSLFVLGLAVGIDAGLASGDHRQTSSEALK
jgi:hypothetical protein